MSTKIKKIPKYQIIENDIIDQINTGVLNDVDPLPTEAQLAEIYKCSRVTVRQALSNLAYKGYIIKEQGSGSYVNKEKAMAKTHLLKSFTDEMIGYDKVPSSVVNTFNITTAGKTVADALKIKETDQVYYIERTRFADEIPVLFEITFMSVKMHPQLSISVLLGSKYKYGDSVNLPVDESFQVITPLFPSEYISQELRISDKQPILRVSNTTYTKEGQVFDYTELYLHPELYQLNISKKRHTQ